ncbi:MAG: copper homeostasis protein CutC, partial [Planctomycetota bacterium]
MIFEVCTETLAGAVAAQKGGADRIELCSRLDLDGLTPSGDLLLQVKETVDLPVLCMVRPHADGFCYTETEFQEALRLKTRTGRPLGSDNFLSHLEMVLGRRIRPL